MINKANKERRAQAKANNFGKETQNIFNGLASTKTEDTFNPREFLLLYKAWKDILSIDDIKDKSEIYTKQGCHDAAKLLNDITGAIIEEKL